MLFKGVKYRAKCSGCDRSQIKLKVSDQILAEYN